MEVKQIAPLVNEVLKSTLGEETTLLTEDLSNLVSIGETIENAKAYDNYVRALVNRIGRMVFVDRQYQGDGIKVLMDSWEYGSILGKVDADLPDVSENESWQLENGTSYDPNIFNAPNGVSVKFYNGLTTFEVDRSITDRQVRESFTSAYEMNKFIEMIFTKISNALTLATENLIKRTINNFIGVTLKNEVPDGNYSQHSGAKAVNLLKLYNDTYTTTLTKEKCIYDKDFIRFATYKMGKYIDMLKTYSVLFNIEKKQRFTPKNLLHVIMLSDLKRASDVFLQSDTYHNELTELPLAETVVKWQGTGEAYDFADVSKIHVKTSEGDTIEADGILAVMFDNDALGVNLYDRRVLTNYNAKSEFTNYFYKQEARYFNSFDENFVVFYVA